MNSKSFQISKNVSALGCKSLIVDKLAQLDGITRVNTPTRENEATNKLYVDLKTFDALVVVKQASDLSGTLDSSKLYFIDGEIDMGSQSIEVPPTGLYIKGHGFGVSILKSTTAGHTMFVDDGTYAGDLFLEGFDIDISGAGSQVFNLDNNENLSTVECTKINIVNAPSIGTLTAYRQSLWINVAFINVSDGLTMEGTWAGGITILSTIIIPSGFIGGTVLKAGGSLVINGSVRTDINALNLDDTGTFCDFAPSNITNDGQFSITGARFNLNSIPFPNMPATDPKARFQFCTGTPNTYPGGVLTDSSSGDTSALHNTLQILPGTTVSSSLAWFVQNGNALEFNSVQTIDIEVTGSLSFGGSNNDELELQIRHWDNSASSYINIGPIYTATLNGGPSGTRAENVSFGAYATVDKDDRIEVWIRNKTANRVISTVVGGSIRVQER